MSEFDTRLAALAAHLATSCPLRTVTRSLKDFAQRDDDELTAGILSVIGSGAGRFRNLRERLGMDATQRVIVVGQIRVAESATPLAVEQAEYTLYDEVIAALRAGTGTLRCIDLADFRQSAQLEHPYGWIALDLEWAT